MWRRERARKLVEPTKQSSSNLPGWVSRDPAFGAMSNILRFLTNLAALSVRLVPTTCRFFWIFFRESKLNRKGRVDKGCFPHEGEVPPVLLSEYLGLELAYEVGLTRSRLAAGGGS